MISISTKQQSKKNRDPMHLFLHESLKLTVGLYIVVALLATTKWLTGGKENLVLLESAFEFSKTWGFILLLVERFLRIFVLLIKSISKSIIEVAEILRKLKQHFENRR